MFRFQYAEIVAAIALVSILLTGVGCHLNKAAGGNSQPVFAKLEHGTPAVEVASNESHLTTSSHIEIESQSTEELHSAPLANAAPRTSQSGLPESFRDISLDEVIQIGLQDTRLLRRLNAQILINPDQVPSSLDPAIVDSNPNFGTAAALSAFDADFRSAIQYANNDDVFNNIFLGGGASEVRQKLTTADWQVGKTTATGTRYSLSTQVLHDFNNSPNNVFDHSWRTRFEASIRKPLLQGAGLDFNRIAGPNARPGFRFSNGILISQLNNEVSAAEFQREVRNYVSSVTTAYWDLYFAYRNFASAQKARDVAYETWMSVKSRFESGLPGGEADAEAQAREQYYEFQLRVNDALSGTAGIVGVLQAEADLRRLIGLSQSDEVFLRPSDQPMQARVAYQWDPLLAEAMGTRIELRQQQMEVRRRELELIAARNFTRPRFDAVGTYRNNGFGDDLAGGAGRFSSALKDATSFEHDEWEIGFQYNLPIGFRQAKTAVRHAELNLQRERIVLGEQNKQIAHDLGTAYRQLDRAWNGLQFSQARFEAAKATVDARTASYQEDLSTIVDLLQSQRRLGEAEAQWYRARAGYTSANFDLLRESGRLLQDLTIYVGPDQLDCGINHIPSGMDYRY